MPTINELKDISWFQRAMNPDTPNTEANNTILTESYEVDGKIILVPTIRMIEGKLVKVDDPVAEATKNNDFIEGFQTEEEATKFSKMISNLVDNSRNSNKTTGGPGKLKVL
jgi:hypothetical protein